jgi:predicted hydrocarbon binding protein/effector-binding domain-containing protein
MTDDHLELYTNDLPDRLVASIRFRGDRRDLRKHLDRLIQQAGSRRNGNPICLRHGGDARCGFDMEICLPISATEKPEPLNIRTLEGGPMICARVERPSGAPENENDVSQGWRSFYATIAKRGIGLAEGPPREVYLLDQMGTGGKTAKTIVELQEYLLLPRWLDRMASGIKRLAGEEAHHRIMAGRENLTAFSSEQEIMHWVKTAVERLDATIAEELRREIMAGCAHIFPQERIQQLRAQFERLGDIDRLIEFMGRDRSLGEQSYYGLPRREGDIIYETKNPQNPKGYREARNEVEKRAQYCHCPIIKTAIRSGVQISSTYCYCGSGWYRRLWNGIMGQPVRVEVVKTVLQGDDVCTFAIHLSAGAHGSGQTPGG